MIGLFVKKIQKWLKIINNQQIDKNEKSIRVPFNRVYRQQHDYLEKSNILTPSNKDSYFVLGKSY